MSCCQRAGSARTPDVRWATAATPPVPAPLAPQRLRFAGPRALSLPAGTRRVLALPGEEVTGLSEAERLALWRTGLFEPLLLAGSGPRAHADGRAARRMASMDAGMLMCG